MTTPATGGLRCSCCWQHDAGHRHACTHCVTQMRQWLRDLDDYATILTATPEPAPSPTTGSIGAAFGSRPPIDVRIATYLDPRSGAGAAVWRLRDPRDMDDEPIRSLPGSIHGIAQWLRSEHDESEPTHWTLASELGYLRSRVDGCAIQSWVNELYDDLRELHRQGRSFAHDVPRPLGHCLNATCDDGLVFWVMRERQGKPVDQARCVACGRTYTGLDLVRLGVAEAAG